MIDALRILVKEAMEIGRNRESQAAQPEREHQPNSGELAEVAPSVRCVPKLHLSLKEHRKAADASHFLRPPTFSGAYRSEGQNSF